MVIPRAPLMPRCGHTLSSPDGDTVFIFGGQRTSEAWNAVDNLRVKVADDNAVIKISWHDAFVEYVDQMDGCAKFPVHCAPANTKQGKKWFTE